MAKLSTSPHPEWARKFRKPGTELRLIRGKYYLYAVSSRYDPVLKRAKKISGSLLGTITESDGFVESSKRLLVNKAAQSIDISTIAVREYGFTAFLKQYNSPIEEKLKQYFPDHYQLIIYMAYCRFIHQSPIKNMPFHVTKSMVSVQDERLYSEKTFSDALRAIGSMREQATGYMSGFVKANDYVLVDMTNIFSHSAKMHCTKEGYNSDMVFDKQFNLMYIYSAGLQQPVFYKLFAGNIKEATGFKICLQESGIKDAITIADKGFYSKANIEMLQQAGLQYISPLKRDNPLIEYSKLKRKELSYFKFEERYIWFVTYQQEGQQVYLFKDEKLKVQEEKDYLDRIDKLPEDYSIEKFHERSDRFGTIAMVSNLASKEAQHIYTSYKSRNNIEVMFDGIKNILHADRTYMQNDDALQGWMFINHIALQWYYTLYTLLKTHNQLNKYSVRDFAIHLYEIKKIKINAEWVTEPLIKASAKFLQKLNIHIT